MSTQPATEPHEHAHPSDQEYVKVALILAVLTGIEVSVYYMNSVKDFLIPILVVLMVTKFTMVVLWFMHLRFDSPLFRRLFVTGLGLAIAVYLIALSSLHIWSR